MESIGYLGVRDEKVGGVFGCSFSASTDQSGLSLSFCKEARMNMEELTDDEFQLIQESLNQYKRNIAEYKDYSSYEFKQEQL